MCDTPVTDADEKCPNCGTLLDIDDESGGEGTEPAEAVTREDVWPEEAEGEPPSEEGEVEPEEAGLPEEDDAEGEDALLPETEGTESTEEMAEEISEAREEDTADAKEAGEEAEAEEETEGEGEELSVRDEGETTGEAETEPGEKKVLVDADLEQLVKLPGVGPLMAKILYDAGYTDLRKLKRATVVELMKIQGIGRKAAGEIKAALRTTDLTELKHQELTEEQVGTEYQCPLCGTIVSSYETSCYECGTAFDSDPVDMGDADRLALSYYDSKLLRTPDNPELWYARGATLMKMEDFNLALNSFDRALEIDPEFQTVWVSKAEVYNKMGDPIKAAECYGHVITRSSKSLDGEEGEEGAAMQVTAKDIKDFEAELDGEPEPAEPHEPPKVSELAEEPVGALVEEALETEASGEIMPGTISEVPDMEHSEDAAGAGRDAETVAEPEVQQPETKLDMDYQKPDTTVELEGKSEKELKHYLSERATYVKPLLLLAKETEMDISLAKRHIAKGVTQSKKGEMMEAVKLVNQGIESIERDFRDRLGEDIGFLADKLRELKVSGMDVSKAVDLITAAKEDIEKNEFHSAFEKMNRCLEMVEKVTGQA